MADHVDAVREMIADLANDTRHRARKDKRSKEDEQAMKTNFLGINVGLALEKAVSERDRTIITAQRMLGDGTPLETLQVSAPNGAVPDIHAARQESYEKGLHEGRGEYLRNNDNAIHKDEYSRRDY